MQSWTTSREIEKPKPLKDQAHAISVRLQGVLDALHILGAPGAEGRAHLILSEAIAILNKVAQGKRV